MSEEEAGERLAQTVYDPQVGRRFAGGMKPLLLLLKLRFLWLVLGECRKGMHGLWIAWVHHVRDGRTEEGTHAPFLPTSLQTRKSGTYWCWNGQGKNFGFFDPATGQVCMFVCA